MVTDPPYGVEYDADQLAITGSGWDPELLRLELGELKLSGFDLSLTGFGDLVGVGKPLGPLGHDVFEFEPHLMVTDPPYGVEYDASSLTGPLGLGQIDQDFARLWDMLVRVI